MLLPGIVLIRAKLQKKCNKKKNSPRKYFWPITIYSYYCDSPCLHQRSDPSFQWECWPPWGGWCLGGATPPLLQRWQYERGASYHRSHGSKGERGTTTGSLVQSQRSRGFHWTLLCLTEHSPHFHWRGRGGELELCPHSDQEVFQSAAWLNRWAHHVTLLVQYREELYKMFKWSDI